MPEIPFGAERELKWEGEIIDIPRPSDLSPHYENDYVGFYYGYGFYIPTFEYYPRDGDSALADDGLLYTLNGDGTYNVTYLQPQRIMAPYPDGETTGTWWMAKVEGGGFQENGFAYGAYFLEDATWGGTFGAATSGSPGSLSVIEAISGTGPEAPDVSYYLENSLATSLTADVPSIIVFDVVEEKRYVISQTGVVDELPIIAEGGFPNFGNSIVEGGSVYIPCSDDSATTGGILKDGAYTEYTFEEGPLGELAGSLLGGGFVTNKAGPYWYIFYPYYDGAQWVPYLIEVDKDGDHYNLIKVTSGNAFTAALLETFAETGEGLSATGDIRDGKIYIIGGEFD